MVLLTSSADLKGQGQKVNNFMKKKKTTNSAWRQKYKGDNPVLFSQISVISNPTVFRHNVWNV